MHAAGICAPGRGRRRAAAAALAGLLAGTAAAGEVAPERACGASADAGAAPASAEAIPAQTPSTRGTPAPAVPVLAVWSDAGALVLADGRQLAPDGVALPTRLAYPARLAEAAAAAAGRALDGCRVGVDGAPREDRHGRLAGPATLACRHGMPAADLATALLREGAGYAQPVAGDGACRAARLSAEAEARAARRGIWAEAEATAQAGDAEAMAIRSGLYTVAEGRILAAGRTRQRVFLNFGSSWRQDFTVMMATEDFATILGDSLDPAMLRGTLVRVRGVVREDGGPAIALHRAGEIERLAGPRERPPLKGRDAR